MAKTLYGREPEAFVVCAGGKEFAHGETLSPEVAGAVPAAAEKVRELVANAG